MKTVDQKVIEVIRDQMGFTSERKIDPEDRFVDLGADSLDIAEIVMALEEQFGIEISDEDGEKLHAVQDAIDLVKKLDV